ncbi:hypothetical protein D3C81_2026050 [compost metagenome]
MLTIHQSIPLQGMANVVISVDTSLMGEQFVTFIETLRGHDGVKRVSIVGQG